MKTSSKARIINVSSKGYKFGKIHFENINLENGIYSAFEAYNQSKLANVLFTRQLAKRLGTDSNIKTFSIHPGLIDTDISRHIFLKALNKYFSKFLLLSPEMGAQTTLYCALDRSLDFESGHHYE